VSPITGQSLMGTLSGLNPQTLSEALIEQQRSELASNVARALEEAQGAGQEYQEAAAAPPPQLAPGAEFLPALFGNIASVLAQTPEYRQRAQEGIQQQKAMLLQTRAQNLQALRDVYQQKAEAAQRLGDMETQEKARVKHEQISKLYDQILDSQRQQGALELERERQKGRKEETSQEHAARLAEIVARGVQERETMGAKPAKAPAERAALVRQGVNPDTGLLTTAFAEREVSRRLALAKRGDQKSRNEAFNTALDLAVQRQDRDRTPKQMVRRLVLISHPFYKGTPKEARYALTDEKIFRIVKGKPVKDLAAEQRAIARAIELSTPWFEGAGAGQP